MLSVTSATKPTCTPKDPSSGSPSASILTDDGRPILFIPSCPPLKKPVSKYYTKPRYTTSVGQLYPSIIDNLTVHIVRPAALVFLGFLITAVPIAIIRGLTRFQIASSTTAERVWTMSWLCFGIFLGFFMQNMQFFWEEDRKNEIDTEMERRSILITLSFILAAPAIGGFVVVGQMLVSFGTCIRIP